MVFESSGVRVMVLESSGGRVMVLESSDVLVMVLESSGVRVMLLESSNIPTLQNDNTQIFHHSNYSNTRILQHPYLRYTIHALDQCSPDDQRAPSILLNVLDQPINNSTTNATTTSK
ncbi:uncharacterized protein LOC143150077 [Ptiloglossa arizonensis]|uniref:uncharacterized protein LOC143150077 n=1 Tax=Ptiloglossa arizonensis TaxID=3350558 RepID=UPI003F9EC910